MLGWASPIYMEQQLNNTVTHLFRNEYGRIIALLTSKYGVSHIEKIEDAVQDTFLKAMRIWGYQKIPDNPTAWLYKVANNGLLDKLRRAKKMSYTADENSHFEATTEASEFYSNTEITDSQLKLIFACCHPSLSKEHQLVLSLKLIGGFSNKELSDALLKKEETVAKSFTRAKKKFKEEVQLLQIPVQMGLQSRLFVVLQVIYLLFSEGYAATSGEQILKRDICYEALRLALLLKKNPYCQHPNLNALIALICFHASRFDARINDAGELVTLEFQDRRLYNKELMAIGSAHLEQAGSADTLPSKYHLEAAVSYHHCTAPTFKETDWATILKLYQLQVQTQYSPMAALNSIIPYAKVHGPKKGLEALEAWKNKNDYKQVALFYTIRAELLAELKKEFKPDIRKAIALTENVLVRRYLKKKLE